jgi:hypothetical protein
MSSNGSPLVDAAQALYDHFRKAVDEMPMPPWVKNPEAPESNEGTAIANKAFADNANAQADAQSKSALSATAAAKIRMKAAGK